MDGERKESPKEALGAGDSTKSSETSGASSNSFEKPAVAIPEAESDVKMQKSDLKEIKSTGAHTKTAIKESETDLKESKAVTESPKTEVMENEKAVNKLEIPLKENNDTEVKKSHTAVIALKELAQKAAGSVKDSETAIKEPKEVHSCDSDVKSDTPMSITENPETDAVPTFETNVKNSAVPTNGTEDSIKETETETKGCAKKDSDSVAENSGQEVKELKKKDEAELKQTGTRAEDTRIISEHSVSESKSSKESEELMDISMESENECRRDNQKKNTEMAMETDDSVNTPRESKNQTKAPKNGTSCSEIAVRDSSTVAEDSEMECSDFDVITDADITVDKSDITADDILLTKENQPVSQGELKVHIEKPQTEIKDSESSRTSAPAVETDEPMIVEPISQTNDKVKEMQASVEKMKITPEAPKTESEKAEESQRLSLQPDDLKVKESKREKTVETLKESVKTESRVAVQGSKTDAVQTQSKINKRDRDESTPDGGNAAPLNNQPASAVSEEQKKLASMKLVKQDSGNTASLVASAVSEQNKLAKVEHVKSDSGDAASRSASAVSEEQKKMAKVEHVKPDSGDAASRKASAAKEEQKNLAKVEHVKPDSGDAASRRPSTVSEEQNKLAKVEHVKPDSGDAASRKASAASEEQKKLAKVEHVKPDSGDAASRKASAASEEQKKLAKVEHVKPDSGDAASRHPLTVSEEQKKLAKVEHVKPDSGDAASRRPSTVSEEQKKLAKVEHVKPDSGDAASRHPSTVSEEQKKLAKVEHVKPDSGDAASRRPSTVSEEQKKLSKVENVKPDSGDAASRKASAASEEQKKLAKVEHVKPDISNAASRHPSTVSEQKKSAKVELVKPDSGTVASRSASAVSEEQKKLTKVEHVKPDSGDVASRSASTVSEEKKKLINMESVKPCSGGVSSKSASAVSEKQKRLAEVKPVKPGSGDAASMSASAVSEKKNLTTLELVNTGGGDAVSRDASAVSEEKKLATVEPVKPDSIDTATRSASEQERLSKVEAIKEVSGDATSRNTSAVSEEQKKLAEVELGKPNGTGTKDLQPASAVSEVPKKLAEVENIKSQNPKTVPMDVQHTETGVKEQEKLAGPDLIKPESNDAVAMDVDPASAVSEESKKLAEVEAQAEPENNKTVTVDVQHISPDSEKLEKFAESDLVKSDNTAVMDIQPTSALSEEIKHLTETECEKPESSKTVNKDIHLTAASSGEQTKLGESELVKPHSGNIINIQPTLSMSEAKKLAEVKSESATALNVNAQNTKTDIEEPKQLTKGEAEKQTDARSTMDVQNTAGGKEALKPSTKVEAGKPEDANSVTVDVQNSEGVTDELKELEPVNPKGASPETMDIQKTEAAAEEPKKLTKELVRTQSVDTVAMDTTAVSKEQKKLSESELVKPSAVEDAPKEKSETNELKSVKAAEEEQISEKLPETEEAVTSEVTKTDTDMPETISKVFKDEKQQKDEEIVILNIDDDEDDEERTPDVIEVQEEPMEKGKNKDSTKDGEESGSDVTYCSRASSATPELDLTQESECEVSGINEKHTSQASTIDVGDLEADSDPDIFASESQAEDLDDTATPPYKEFVTASQDKGRAIKSSTTLGAESQGNEDKQRTSVKRKHDTSDSSDAPESSIPPRKEARVDICDTEEEKMEDDDIVPATAPESKPVDIVQKSGNIPKPSRTAINAAEDLLELKEVQISPKADRKRPAEESLSPKTQRKLDFEDEPQKEPVSARKKLKLNTDESENPEVEVLEAKNSRKSIEVIYMKQPSLQRSSAPNAQKERLEKVEESKDNETEEEGEKDELSDSQDLILRLSPSPSQASQMSSSFKAQVSPSLSNSTPKAEAVSNAETLEETVQENSNGPMETIVEVEESKVPSIQQNGDNCTIIDIEKEDKVKLSEKLKRKRDDAPVIDVHGSDSECENTQTPDDKKRKTTENGHKDTPPLPHPVHLLKEREKKHSTPDDEAHIHRLAETSASSIELEHEKDTHPEISYNEETVTYLKKVTQDVLLKVEVSKQGNKIVYLGVEQCKVIAEDDYQPAAPGLSDLSSGNLADTSATGSPSSVVSGPVPFALPNNRFSIMTTSSSSSGASSTALGALRGRSTSDIGFTAPSLVRIPRAGKDSFQSDIGVSANRRIEHMDVIEDVLISVVDVENDIEKRMRTSRTTETCNIKEDVKEDTKKSFCDAFTTMNTSPAQMEVDSKVRGKEEQVDEGPPSQETPRATRKRFAGRMRSATKAQSVPSKSRGSTDESVSSLRERRKSKEQEKQEAEKSVQEVGKRSTRIGSNSSHSEDAQGTKSKEAALKRSTRKQSNSEAPESTDDTNLKRSTRNRSDSNVSSSESKEKSTPTPTAKRSTRKRSSSDTPETKDDSKEPKAKQAAVSISKRNTRKRSDSSFTESAEEAKGSRTPSGKSSLEMQDSSSKAATPFTPKTERKKEKEAAVPQTPEHVSMYTLKEMKPGLAVFAKWTDRKYYSAKLKELQTDGRWMVEFDDGKSKPLLEDYIVAVDQLSKGQLVYAMNEEEEYIHGVIKNVEKRGRKETYIVELDEGETVSVTRKELFMTEDQAKILRENIASTPVKTTPHRLTELTLDNVLEGKRSRSKKNLDSPSQSPSTSGLNKKGKPPSSASSEVESASGVEYVDGVQRESTGHVVSRRIKGKGTGDPKKNVDDYGVMPKEGSNIFKGKCFLLTSTDAPPMQAATKLDDSIHNTTTSTEDDDSAAAEDYCSVGIPFSKAHLTQQIRAGGGTVYNKFEDIPPSEYKNCFLISNRPNLTAKYILCLVHNIPVVSHGWIFKSCKGNKLESFTNYELPAGWSVLENKYIEVKKKRRSLNNLKIGLVSESKYFLKFWETVLKAAGASVLRIPPEGVNKQMKLQVIISNSSCPFEVQKQAKDLAIPIVSTMWIVQCLINGTRVPFDHHPQFNYDHSFSD